MSDWTGTWTYGYDANNRLTAAAPPNPVPEQPAGGPYEYDWVGNRVRPPRDPNPPSSTNKMIYNAADQLTTWPGMHTYTYYDDGSLKEEKNAAGTSVMKSYTYTPDGLLHTATFDGGTKTLENTWDADKNRVGFNVDSTDHKFVYDATAGIPSVIQEDGVYYLREPGGELLAMIDPVKGDRCYHFDQLGSTRLLTNSTGTVTDEYAYDAYGALLSHNRHADSVDQPYQYVGRLGYCTHWQEPGFGLAQLGVRFYDASAGRFTQRDPVESDFSDYWYATGLPISAVDPSGMYSLLTCPNYASCHKCTGDQAAKGWRDIENWLKKINPKQKLIGGPNDQVDNEANAVGHCVKACRSVRYCKNDCQQAGGPLASLQDHECYAFGPWRQACLMDKYNNQQGANCAAGGQSCVGCCLDLFNKGKLRWLKPKRNWPQ